MKSVLVRDGRRVCYAENGAPDGRPVFMLHGMPGSRVGPRPRGIGLYLGGVRMIAYDRPGFGGSTRREGRSVAHSAEDVADLADHLGLERFAVVGRSGGTPHALACAALLPERVTRAAALASFAPVDLLGAEWYRDMSAENTAIFRTAAQNPGRLPEVLARIARRLAGSETPGVAGLDLHRTDLAVVGDYGIRQMLRDNIKEALRDSLHGWVDDVLAVIRPWGFDLGQIGVPVALWHGARDALSPVTHSRALVGRIPTAQLKVGLQESHFGTLLELPRLLGWLAGDDSAVLDGEYGSAA